MHFICLYDAVYATDINWIDMRQVKLILHDAAGVCCIYDVRTIRGFVELVSHSYYFYHILQLGWKLGPFSGAATVWGLKSNRLHLTLPDMRPCTKIYLSPITCSCQVHTVHILRTGQNDHLCSFHSGERKKHFSATFGGAFLLTKEEYVTVLLTL